MLYDVISSGSKGNATLVLSSSKAILLDFGISKKRVVDALKGYGLGFDDIMAFFLGHGHDDHASDAFQAPNDRLYASFEKIPKSDKPILPLHLLKPFSPIHVDPFTITPLPLSHDFKNTMGFLVDDGKERLVYVTDTGFLPEKDFPYLQNCDYILLESNHDAQMLFQSKRPDYLIKRIVSDKGHLSNVDCACYLSLFIGEKTKECCLLHLSEECNDPLLAKETYEKVMMERLGYLPDVILRVSSAQRQTQGGTR